MTTAHSGDCAEPLEAAPAVWAIVDDAHSFGGAQLALARAVEAILERTDVRLRLYLPTASPLRPMLPASDRLVLLDCPSAFGGNIWTFWRSLPTWNRIVASDDADVWFLNLPGIEFSLSAAFILKLRRKPFVGWLHLAQKFATLRHGAHWSVRLADRARDLMAEVLVLPLYQSISTPSHAESCSLIERQRWRLPFPKVSVLSNVASRQVKYTEAEKVAKRAELLAGGAERLILAVVGRISFVDKGQDRAVELSRHLELLGVEHLFVFVGDGPDEAELERRFATAGLSRNLILAGWHDDAGPFMAASDIVLITSRFESFSLVALEAMSRGVRVVSVPLRSTPEVLPAECIASGASSNELAIAIQHSLSLPQSELMDIYHRTLARFQSAAFVAELFSD